MALFQKLYYREYYQDIPLSLEEAWKFFETPANLKKIAPEYMGLGNITSKFDGKMYEGMLITYVITPLFGIPMNWCTEITEIKPMQYFIDEQRFGPFAMWHHEHWYEEIEGGVRMTDKVTYGIKFGPLGQLMNSLVVSKDVDKIFRIREESIEKLFGKMPTV